MPLLRLKRFALKLIVAEELRPGSRSTVAEQQAVERIEREFLRYDENDEAFRSAASSVQDVFAKQLIRVADLRDLLIKYPEELPHFDLFHARLKNGITRKQCSNCGGSHACDGGSQDAKRLNDPGLCISVINELLVFLKASVESILKDCSYEEGIPFESLDIEIDRIFIGAKSGAASPEGAYYRDSLGGCTEFIDVAAPGSRRSRITLEFDGSFFDWHALLAVPWVITHELVCHAFQGRCDKVRRSCSSDCPFYEGWMDEVASKLLDAIVLRHSLATGLATQSNILAQHPSQVIDQRDDFRLWRYRRNLANRGTPYTLWDLGKLGAQNVLNFFDRKIVTSQESRFDAALWMLLKLSMRVQSRDPSHVQAAQIAALLGSLGAYGASGACAKQIAQEICDVMFSSINTVSWIKALEERCSHHGL
jgi:hypothetical protein